MRFVIIIYLSDCFSMYSVCNIISGMCCALLSVAWQNIMAGQVDPMPAPDCHTLYNTVVLSVYGSHVSAESMYTLGPEPWLKLSSCCSEFLVYAGVGVYQQRSIRICIHN